MQTACEILGRKRDDGDDTPAPAGRKSAPRARNSRMVPVAQRACECDPHSYLVAGPPTRSGNTHRIMNPSSSPPRRSPELAGLIHLYYLLRIAFLPVRALTAPERLPLLISKTYSPLFISTIIVPPERTLFVIIMVATGLSIFS